MENWRMRVLKMDTEGSADNSALATEYGVRALPTILWIAADGSVLQRAEGPLSTKMIQAISEHLFFDGAEPIKTPARANVQLPDAASGVLA